MKWNDFKQELFKFSNDWAAGLMVMKVNDIYKPYLKYCDKLLNRRSLQDCFDMLKNLKIGEEVIADTWYFGINNDEKWHTVFYPCDGGIWRSKAINANTGKINDSRHFEWSSLSLAANEIHRHCSNSPPNEEPCKRRYCPCCPDMNMGPGKVYLLSIKGTLSDSQAKKIGFVEDKDSKIHMLINPSYNSVTKGYIDSEERTLDDEMLGRAHKMLSDNRKGFGPIANHKVAIESWVFEGKEKKLNSAFHIALKRTIG